MSALAGPLWVELVAGVSDAGVWVVTESGRDALQLPETKGWIATAAHMFAAEAELASVSAVAAGSTEVAPFRQSNVTALQADRAALPMCFISGRVADLIGIGTDDDQHPCPVARFQNWIEAATLKGLVHTWLIVEGRVPGLAGAPVMPQVVPALEGAARVRLVPLRLNSHGLGVGRLSLSLGIDAAWLLGGESGAQVLVFQMLRELAVRPEIERIALLSESGEIPRSLAGVSRIEGISWKAALDREVRWLDILHRPYQPGADVDYRRYRKVAKCVAMTVLDFIAYDNPAYHESLRAWRQYQDAFDDCVRLADALFAISHHVGSRLERQFAHQLTAPVRTVLLGTDHLQSPGTNDRPETLGPDVAALQGSAFLLVLGNDFEHKNRDFAVSVFRDMCARGYEGGLVLAGFHLDGGSSFKHELSDAGDTVERIVRMRAVSGAEKAWLMRRADAVLYPTSSEGFGLVPFEAAALGTPTAFVRFGPLRETLPEVSASASWNVRSFADHVFTLLKDGGAQVQQIQAISASLTWKAHVDQVLTGYQAILSDGAPWQIERRQMPGLAARINRIGGDYAHRAVNRLRRAARPLITSQTAKSR